VTPPCSRARDQREYGSEAHDGLDTLPVPAVSCRVSESERAVPSRAITEIERARVCFGVTDSIEGQEQHAPLEMMAPRVNPVRCVGAFSFVLLEQVENGLLCWRGHCWRARGCHESPPVRRSRRVPRAVGTAALSWLFFFAMRTITLSLSVCRVLKSGQIAGVRNRMHAASSAVGTTETMRPFSTTPRAHASLAGSFAKKRSPSLQTSRTNRVSRNLAGTRRPNRVERADALTLVECPVNS